jgi:hypothetical protein
VCGWETRVQRGCGGTNLKGACSACSEVQVQRRGRRLSRMPRRVLMLSTHLQEEHGGCRCMHEQTNGLRVRTACAGGQATTRGSPPAGSISAVSARVKS